MSQRMGMADGRCFTTNIASPLLNDSISKQLHVKTGHEYRKYLQDNADMLLHEFNKPSPECIKVIGSE